VSDTAFTSKINGTPHEVDVDGDTPLLWVLRDVLGMTATKFGCGQALCCAASRTMRPPPMFVSAAGDTGRPVLRDARHAMAEFWTGFVPARPQDEAECWPPDPTRHAVEFSTE
jgi:hypothetical protein